MTSLRIWTTGCARSARAFPTVVAMRDAGRHQEATQLLSHFARTNAALPETGLGGVVKRINLANIAVLSGRNEEALSLLDLVSREAPLVLLPSPTMSLSNNPFYQGLKGNARLAEIDERLRSALNGERRKAGMAPVSRQAWLSDPNTLLTKN